MTNHLLPYPSMVGNLFLYASFDHSSRLVPILCPSIFSCIPPMTNHTPPVFLHSPIISFCIPPRISLLLGYLCFGQSSAPEPLLWPKIFLFPAFEQLSPPICLHSPIVYFHSLHHLLWYPPCDQSSPPIPLLWPRLSSWFYVPITAGPVLLL